MFESWAKQLRNIPGESSNKRDPKFTPRKFSVQYYDWRLFEVILPVALGPALLVAFLTLYELVLGHGNVFFQPVVSAIGSGDLLIFSAFLLINASARFAAIENKNKDPDDVAENETRSIIIFILGISILLVYTVTRVMIDVGGPAIESWVKFAVGIFSIVLLAITITYLDGLMLKMQIALLERKIVNTLVRVNYVR